MAGAVRLGSFRGGGGGENPIKGAGIMSKNSLSFTWLRMELRMRKCFRFVRRYPSHDRERRRKFFLGARGGTRGGKEKELPWACEEAHIAAE